LRTSAALAGHGSPSVDRYLIEMSSGSKIQNPMERTMIKKNTAPSTQQGGNRETNLDSRYGKIGISALAAALQFKSEAKNPAYAPAAQQTDEERPAQKAA
jgi:hypothetical protein